MGRLLRGPTPETFWEWFGGIWLAVGALFLIIGIGAGVAEYRALARLRTEGVATSGTVLTKSATRSSSGGSSSSLTYRVTYRFTTVNGQAVPGTAEVSVEAWDRLQERGPIEVRYVPASPSTHRVGPIEAGYFVSLMLGTVGAVFTSLGGFVLWRAAGFRSSARDDHRRPNRSVWVGHR